VRYGSFMAGMKDEAGRGGRGRCLAEDHLSRLQTMVDEGMDALDTVEWKRGEVLAIERKTRAIGVMGRTIKVIDGLRPKPGKSHANDNEDEMREGETAHGDDMDPAEFARLRAELECRLNRLRANIETKREARRHLLGSGDVDRRGDDPGLARPPAPS
jgi:hypothetical protein